MKWTKSKKIIAVICGIAMLFMMYGIVHSIIINKQYNEVIAVIKQGDYITAEEMLIDLNVTDKNDDEKRAYFRFYAVVSCEYPDIENVEHYFADSAVLYVYISAMEYYNDDKFEYAKNRINLVPENYSGALCEEIKASKQEINKRYEEYEQELEKAKEEYIRTSREKLEKEKQEKKQKLAEEMDSYADKLPYEGMSEFFIEYTQLGKPDKYRREESCDTFIWYDKGYCVRCRSGKVEYVENISMEILKEDYNGYWMKDFDSKVIADVFSVEGRWIGANLSQSSSHSSPSYGYSHRSSNCRSDPYNVYDYDDAEDFYYDNEEDFDGIDDAESYFDEHND